MYILPVAHHCPRPRPPSCTPLLHHAWNWAPTFAICGFLAIVFVGFGGTAIYYSIQTIVQNSQTYGIFAQCYQCPANYKTLLNNPSGTL